MLADYDSIRWNMLLIASLDSLAFNFLLDFSAFYSFMKFLVAGVPDPPSNCTITNQTSASFEIDCNEGYDGGIPQHFKMHVFDIKTRTLLANLTSSSPKFALHLGSSAASGHSGSAGAGGSQGQNDSPRTHSWKSNAVGEEADVRNGIRRPGNGVYGSIAVIPPVGTLLQLTAVNAHGISDAIFLEATSVPGLPAEMQASGVSNFEFSPTLGILIGIVATGVLLMVALMTGIKFRCHKPAQPEVKSPAKAKTEYIELGTKDPDLIAQEKGERFVPGIVHFHQCGSTLYGRWAV